MTKNSGSCGKLQSARRRTVRDRPQRPSRSTTWRNGPIWMALGMDRMTAGRGAPGHGPTWPGRCTHAAGLPWTARRPPHPAGPGPGRALMQSRTAPARRVRARRPRARRARARRVRARRAGRGGRGRGGSRLGRSRLGRPGPKRPEPKQPRARWPRPRWPRLDGPDSDGPDSDGPDSDGPGSDGTEGPRDEGDGPRLARRAGVPRSTPWVNRTSPDHEGHEGHEALTRPGETRPPPEPAGRTSSGGSGRPPPVVRLTWPASTKITRAVS